MRCKALRERHQDKPTLSVFSRQHPHSPGPSWVSYSSSAIKNLLPGSQVQPAQCLEAYLQVGELTERLGTDITLIFDLAVLLLQRVGKSLVTSHVSFVFDEIHGSVSAGGCHHC